MKAKNEAFDGYMQSVRNAQRVRERSNADFDEIIRGYRTVEDTQTGYRKDVNLGYSKEIVDKLNEHEGYARYKEIPLRDQ
jgi:sulfatase maturation enzyme AslB (radical SAM superfamily)